ncbi:MAG: efflux RND transporter permease subunit [Phycisphaerales bacterium]|nr:MAG: efflux RND transporter permease subunit [Phycisphaerales bacterium]
MSLSGFALRYRVIVVTAVVLLMLWGTLSYLTMPRREDPEYVVRTCQVLTQWTGTPVEKVEELITQPLEDEINGLDGIRWVRSETTVGRSAIYVELDRSTPGADVEQMWDKVRSRVDRVAMPEPGIVPLVIDDFGDTNIMLLALHQVPLPGDTEIRSENRYSARDLEIFSDILKDELKLLDGVAKVDIAGVLDEVIYLETDLGTWTNLSLTSRQLQLLISQRNVIATGGSIDTDVGRFSVKPSGDISAVREIEAIVVGALGERGSQAPVYLNDLGLKVVRGYEDPPRVITRYTDANGSMPCVIVAFSMKAGANIVRICESARTLLARLKEQQKVLPPDLAIGIVSDQSENVTRKISDFMKNVAGAVVIVVLVVFLMVGLRSASVMAANIPLVVIGSLAIVPLFGVQLEQISLAAMIIALGMLVDNAVQIADQTRRLQKEGKTPFRAALDGANELAFPIFIATGTTVAAFYPMLIGLQGSTKEYVYSLPVTITVVLLLSYVLAMTFCVLLASWFIRPPKDPNASLSPVVQVIGIFRKGSRKPKREGAGLYAKLILACLRAKWFVVAAAFGVLFLVLSLPVGSEFFPQDIRDQLTIDVWLPEGASIEQTDGVNRQVEEIVRRLSPHEGKQRLRAMASIAGKGMPRWYLGRSPEAPKPYYGELVIRTTDGLLTGPYAEDIQRVVQKGDKTLGLEPVAGARVIVRQLMMGPVVDAPIGIRLFGPRQGAGYADLEVMREQAEALKQLFRERPGTWDIYDTWGSSSYELRVKVDEDKANLAGVTNANLAQTLNAYFSGHHLTTFREGDHLVPVLLRLPPEQRGSLAPLRSAYVEGLKGKVPLDSIASLEPRWEPAKIERRFLQRVIEARARNLPGYRANDIVVSMVASDGFKKWEKELPPGYWWEIGGELFESNNSKPEMQLSFSISLLAIVMLLIIQYNGIVKPFIILATLPLALIGAIGGLYITGYPLGFMPQLGLLALFGIVVNTAIIYLEFADSLIEKRAAESDGSGPIMGLTRQEFRECLMRAGEVRLLPIAMTTLTTIGGLLPLALAGGPLWEGMSWLMIFGLIVATILTLVVVPALYAIFVETFRVRPLPAKQVE